MLAAVAGCVDAASYTELGGVFTANMTGNTVLLGLAVAGAHGAAAARAACAVGGFCAGTALAAGLNRTRPGLACEALVLSAVAALSATMNTRDAGWRLALLGAGGAAMGLQAGTVRRCNTTGVNVTYITGTITTLISRAADRALGRRRDPDHPEGVAVPLAVLVAYALGALGGALICGWAAWPGFGVPAAGVFCVAAGRAFAGASRD